MGPKVKRARETNRNGIRICYFAPTIAVCSRARVYRVCSRFRRAPGPASLAGQLLSHQASSISSIADCAKERIIKTTRRRKGKQRRLQQRASNKHSEHLLSLIPHQAPGIRHQELGETRKELVEGVCERR